MPTDGHPSRAALTVRALVVVAVCGTLLCIGVFRADTYVASVTSGLPPLPNCPSARHTPGGADHFGGCWPGPANTGVPTGVLLGAYDGPCNITVDGTVIDGREINCDLTVSARDAEIRRSLVNGTIATSGLGSLTISDSRVAGGPPSPDGETIIASENLTIIRVEVAGGNRGIFCLHHCVVRDSWVHGQYVVGDLHASGIRQSQGATLIHNTIVCDARNTSDGGCSADLTGYGDVEPVRDNLIQQNLFLASPAAFCVYGGSSGDDGSKAYGDQASNIDFIDNVFQTGSSGVCGAYGPAVSFDSTRPGNSWIDNHWSNGELIPIPPK